MLNDFPSVEGIQTGAIVRGIIWTLILTIFLGLILSLLLHFTPLSESLLAGFSTFIFFFSMLGGASIGAWAAGSKGLLHGLIIAITYWLFTLIIGLMWSPDVFTFWLIAKRLGFSLISGALGGIIGIGLSNK